MSDSVFTRFRRWFQNNFVFFGPGLLLAITAAGEAGVTEAIEIGAHYGSALIWVVIITLIFKYAFTNGIARYTFATNQTIFDALNRLPGPKNWGSYLIIGSYLMEMFAIGFMFLGYAGYAVSFMPHGAEITLDTLITQILYIFSSIPYGPYLFLMFVAIIFFGAVVVGMDARARALAKVVRHLGEDTGVKLPSEYNLNQITLLVFTAVIILAMVIAELSAILFGIFGFIVIYLDSRLPKYAKGSRIWTAIMMLGSGLSIYVALLRESSFLENGIPLIERMLVIVVILFVFTKTEMFKKLVNGTATLADKA